MQAHHGFSGTERDFQAHRGQCFIEGADITSSAVCYARKTDDGCGTPAVAIVEIDTDGLRIARVDGGGDDGYYVGDFANDFDGCDADIIIYDDGDWNGNSHETVRLMSWRAVDAVRLVRVEAIEDDED